MSLVKRLDWWAFSMACIVSFWLGHMFAYFDSKTNCHGCGVMIGGPDGTLVCARRPK